MRARNPPAHGRRTVNRWRRSLGRRSTRRESMKLSVAFVAGLLLVPAAGVYAQGVDDAQIASIVVTANQVDIDAGKLASSMAKRADVKKFGALMVTDHSGVNKAAVDLATKLKV